MTDLNINGVVYAKYSYDTQSKKLTFQIVQKITSKLSKEENAEWLLGLVVAILDCEDAQDIEIIKP